MIFPTRKHSVVWGGLLVLFGLMSLIETYVSLSTWVWVVVLASAGLGIYGYYAADRSEKWMLIPSYILLVVAGLIALITINVLRDEAIATYVLSAIALPFLVVFLRDRKQWWALIPAYALLAVGVMVALIGVNYLADEMIALYVLTAIALPFLAVYLWDRGQWWALIPAYALLAVGTMVALIGAGVLDGILIAAYVNIAIAVPFFVVYFRDSKQWWALIPGGITAAIGISFLIAEAAVEYIIPVVLMIAGAWIIVRQFTRKEPPGLDVPLEVDQEDEKK